MPRVWPFLFTRVGFTPVSYITPFTPTMHVVVDKRTTLLNDNPDLNERRLQLEKKKKQTTINIINNQQYNNQQYNSTIQ